MRMWLKIKWDMFVTSFIPLWLSILIFDIWDIITVAMDVWARDGKLVQNLTDCVINSKVQLLCIGIIVLMVSVSVHGINSFLKERECSNQNSPGTILKARRANKLSSEFLLAYILPLIAFDFSDLKSIVLFLIYFAILAFLCIRNNNIYTNIMLEFKHYRLYTCDIQCVLPGNKTVVYYDSLVVSRDDLTSLEDNEIKFWDCDNYIYIHIRGGASNE